ncbi:MAG TPA: 23S rRNA (guanosine(2251)-2'-O)-methyltransferase RlmB [Acidobacteriota bacterium]|nr:23S rRNA (guanosine(2251)-2'-O)-methyltransferase RlmB [Acidobacteriota bacterium]
MIIAGINPVREALASRDQRLQRVLVTKGKRNPRLGEIIKMARDQGVPVRFEPAGALNRQAPDGHHQDVLAVLSEMALSGLEEILQDKPTLLLVVDNIEDPRNLGAVLRTAEAAGVEGVLVPERRSASLTSTVIKASAGAAMHLRIAQIGNVAQTLRRLKDAGLWTVGLDADGEHGLGEVDVSLPLAVVVGGEHKGLRPLVRKHCDFVVSLPMKGKVNSLNLSVAAAVVLYQIVLTREAAQRPTSNGQLTRNKSG